MESQETTPTTTVGLSTESPGLSTESPGAISKPSPVDKPVQEWLEIGTNFLSKIYDYIGEFISDNEKLLVNLLLIFLAVIAVKVTLAILAAINDFPLLSPLFELIGLGYTAWFVYRYLWKESSRQELKEEFKVLQSQVMGRNK
ncbi:MAG: CAAD domain-containing protein [Xenococcaceae cyanobacterium MO_188.B19]|nr:CAAD domain-containing protein [Xenococcaceae cyanobacterium MO_188.B19]